MKPIFSAIVMGMVAFDTQFYLASTIGNAKATIVAILAGMITYALMLVFTRTFNKDDFTRIPYGMKLYSLLKKLRLYSE